MPHKYTGYPQPNSGPAKKTSGDHSYGGKMPNAKPGGGQGGGSNPSKAGTPQGPGGGGKKKMDY